MSDLKPIQGLRPFTKFCCTIGNIPASYLAGLTYEEQLLWFCDYLQNTVIPTINNNAEAVEELQNLYKELKSYVDNYFTSLDVQEEINNKLDTMAQDGTLADIINPYLDNFTKEVNNNLSNFKNSINVQNTKIDNFQNEINNFSNRLDNFKNNSPAGVYESLEALISADPDHSKVYITTDNGNWNYYNGSTWVAGGTYQATEIANGSIAPEMTNFKEKVGLIPSFPWIEGQALSGTTGNPITFENGCYCPTFIEIDNSIIYASNLDKRFSILFYDSNYSYISSSSFLNTIESEVPENAKYIRITCTLASFNILPEDFTQLFQKEDLLKTSNIFQKAKTKENYKENYVNDILINEKNIVIFKTGYNSQDEIIINKNNAIITSNVDANKTSYRGIRITQNLQIGDILEVDLGDNVNNIQTVSLYTYNVSKIADITILNGIGELLITEDIYNTLKDNFLINLTYALTTGSLNQQFVVNMTINVKGYPYTLKDFIENYNNNETNTKYNAIFLGDSITARTGDTSWIQYLSNIIPLNIFHNVAVSGAQLKDTSPNQEYDGNPTYFPNNPANVLGNQVQKILNNNYDEPDFIMIAIGTNGGINVSSEDEIFNTYYDAENNPISLSSVNRETDAGAFRYCTETLQNKYPNAKIVWCTPIQATQKTRDVKNIIQWGNNLKKLCDFASVYCIDTEKCGICGIREIQNENGFALTDGLHPNATGAKLIGEYNANEFKRFL